MIVEKYLVILFSILKEIFVITQIKISFEALPINKKAFLISSKENFG